MIDFFQFTPDDLTRFGISFDDPATAYEFVAYLQKELCDRIENNILCRLPDEERDKLAASDSFEEERDRIIAQTPDYREIAEEESRLLAWEILQYRDKLTDAVIDHSVDKADTPVDEMGLPPVTCAFLHEYGIYTVGGILATKNISWMETAFPRQAAGLLSAVLDFLLPDSDGVEERFRITPETVFEEHRNEPPESVLNALKAYLHDEAALIRRNPRLKRHLFYRTYTVPVAEKMLALNDTMAEAYRNFFGRECGVVWTATNLEPAAAEKADLPAKQGIAYLGDVGLGRNRQLAEIAGALRECAGPGIPECLDVYSAETDPEILKPLQEHPGIRFHGAVPGNRVPEIIRESRAVIHTESFDPVIRERIRYSLSTKIADSLAGGTCLLAYGPAEAASMDYLIRNGAAFAATSPEELRTVLPRVFTDDEAYLRTSEKAAALAWKNHRPETTRETIRSTLAEAAEKQEINRQGYRA